MHFLHYDDDDDDDDPGTEATVCDVKLLNAEQKRFYVYFYTFNEYLCRISHMYSVKCKEQMN